MSADKQKIEQLAQKVDELLMLLKPIVEDLQKTSDSLKSLAVGQITAKPASPAAAPRLAASAPALHPQTSAPLPTLAASAPKSQSIEDIRMIFPEELDSMLAFEDKGDFVMIKPKGFLGSDNFAKIASTVRGMGGEYISQGRDSHFRVYRKKA